MGLFSGAATILAHPTGLKGRPPSIVSITQPQVHVWTRDEYHRMADLGFFEGQRVELVEGQVIEMAAMKSPHAAAVDLVEVADTSVSYDRTVKGSLYAKAGIAEYWILNLVKRQLEVYQQPVEDAEATYGWHYGEGVIYHSRFAHF